MAGRPTKQGIDYFPMDVGFFSDVKIRKISRACGSQSASILICLLCNIYKDEGYYIVWDEDLPFVIADIVGVSEGAVKEVLIKALQVGFFDNTLYEKYHVLTSFGVITLLDKCDLKALPLQGEKWYEIDDVQDLDIAETLFAEEGLSLYQKRYGGYWRFPTLLDFCYLVNPYFPPQRMVEEMKSNFATLLTEYPSGMSVNNLLISKYFNLNRDYVCVGNGAAELIKVLMEFLEGNLGVIYPTFEEYPNRYPNQHIISYVPDNTAFSYSVSDLQNYFSDKSLSALLLINPDNPSGNFISRDDVLKLADWAGHKGITLIVDESFVDFAEGGLDSSLLLDSILDSYPHLIVLKSISKSYGVPGLRLGILASSNRQVIDRIRKEVSIWNINSFAEFYMQIYGKYESDYRKACERFQSERTRFYKELSSISFLRVIPSQANYFLCEVIAKYSSTALTRLLLYSSNILIKDCSTKQAFNNGNYIRIAIRNEADNNKLLSRLKELDC